MRSIRGTFAGSRMAALIPAIPAPTTMTFILGAASMGCSSIASGCHVTLSLVVSLCGAGCDNEFPIPQVTALSFDLRLQSSIFNLLLVASALQRNLFGIQ